MAFYAPILVCLSAIFLVHVNNNHAAYGTDFIGILAAFVGCWLVSFVLMLRSPLKIPETAGEEEQRTMRQDYGRYTKNVVGLAACALSLYFLGSYNRATGGEFEAFSVSTGYLVFDLCYSIINNCYPKPIWLAMPDAIALAAFFASVADPSQGIMDQFESYHDFIMAWVSYKTIVFAINHYTATPVNFSTPTA
jgi:hypothetical protein